MNVLLSPFVMTIFGATGDLTQRKLLPALFHLFQKGILPEHFFIVGFSRRNYSTEDFREFLRDALHKYDTKHTFNERLWQTFSGKLYYQQGNFHEHKGYLELIDKLAEFDIFMKACVPRYFYLATPPSQYGTILDFLNQTKLAEGCGPYFAKTSTDFKVLVDKSSGKPAFAKAQMGEQGKGKWTKVMIEKLFGRSLEDAQKLDMKLAQIFKEEQIYRIDHYLGKETVQNILAFRYCNTIFDAVWNRQFIDHVQITIAETLGVETRGNFYEGVGALRDMAQSHLLELMAAIAMKPQRLDSEGIRTSRTKMIENIVYIESHETCEKTVRGQYEGYRKEANVLPNSNTETFVALKLTLDDSRWHDVPFYLRTGKKLARKSTEISVILKEPRHKLFKSLSFLSDPPVGGKSKDYLEQKNVSLRQAQAIYVQPDILTFRIEPDEGITCTVNAKQVGLSSNFEQIPLSFSYHKDQKLPDAYERLLLDAMLGDQTLFTRTDEVAAAWEVVGKIGEGWWNEGDPHFPNYAAGSWGPVVARELIERDGRSWLLK